MNAGGTAISPTEVFDELRPVKRSQLARRVPEKHPGIGLKEWYGPRDKASVVSAQLPFGKPALPPIVFRLFG